MARVTVRDAIVLMLLLWIPMSLYLLVTHSSRVKSELRTDLIRQLRRDHEEMAPYEFAPGGVHHPHTAVRGAGGAPAPAAAAAGTHRMGWPASPLYDPANRAMTVEDMDLSQFEDADWLQVANTVYDKNRWMLETVPTAHNITMVSGLWDLGRDRIKSGQAAEMFKRPFSYYTEKLAAFLAYDFPKVLFCEEEHEEDILKMVRKSTGGPIRLIFKSKAEIRRSFPDFDLLQNIRKRRDWYSRASWLASAPQASLEYYNPVVMSKLFFTRDVARWNPYNTDRFLWVDAAHLCNNPIGIGKAQQSYMLTFVDKLLITFFDYEPFQEIHGFEHDAFDKFLGVDKYDKTPLKVGRGGVFGGPRPYLEVASAVYEIILSETLSRGYMGTEENLFSILDYRFPDLVHHYDNKDGGNCAVFNDWVSHIDFTIAGYDIRGLTCRYVTEDNGVRCFDKKVKCPSHVTPEFLTVAKGQGLCQHERNYFCHVTCQPRSEEVLWQGMPCDGSKCPPPRFFDEDFSKAKGQAIERELARQQEAADKVFKEDPIVVPSEDVEDVPMESLAAKPDDVPPTRVEPVPGPVPLHGPEVEPPPAPEPAAAGTTALTGRELVDAMEDGKNKDTMGAFGFDLRGLQCQVLNGKEQCFSQEEFHRELCPPFVTSVYLSLAKGQWTCEPAQRDYYCVATCQEGVDHIAWSAAEIKHCDAHPDGCPKRPAVIPVDEFKVQPWDGKKRKVMQCDAPPGGMPDLTAVMLVRNEVETLRNTLGTYARAGFLQELKEFILFVNGMSAEMDEVIAEYKQPPYNIKVMGDSENHGITYPLNWLVGNATYEHVLFLEKDFQLVESGECAMEQLSIGLNMIKSGKAHIARYRSRHLAGKPNWAEITYRGKEDTVFKRQPNLLCNFYHWVFNPDQRWPGKFWSCHTGEDGKTPPNENWYCSDAEFCNWTNNPVLMSKTWWTEEYINTFPNFKASNPYKNLEGYMNWEKGAWNTRGWTVAQGEGLFKHADTKNFGGGW